MMRVLHLLSREATFQTARGLALLTGAAVEGYQAIALRIGRGGDYKGPLRAAAALRFGHAGFDLIHAWDPGSFMAAIASGVPVIYSPSELVKQGTWSWLATAAYADVHVAASSRWACAAQIRAGMPAERCHMILPAIDPGWVPAAQDPNLRRELGFSLDDWVVLAPGESTASANHRLALHATAIMAVMDKRYRFLMWGRGPEARAIREFGARMNQPGLLIDAQRRLGRGVEFEELLSVADVALVTATAGAPLLPIAACAAAGMPIIATDSRLIRQSLGTRAVSIAPGKGARPLAQRLLELHEKPETRRVLGDAAKRESRLGFDAPRFVREYTALYQRVVADRQHALRRTEAAPAALG